jgi:2-polyprenyl-6-methoxyphenol hydroxylase-like FAD-dependent oxidoreductase
MAQVVIAGAGPTGACLEVLLVEAAKDFRRQFRGQALMPSGLAALRAMDLSTIAETVPHQTLEAWEFWIEGKRLFRADEPIEAEGPPCTLVSQPEFLAAVVERARACPNFTFVPGTTVQGLEREGDRITGVTLSDGRAIATTLVIATDGRNSTLRDKANLTLAHQHSFKTGDGSIDVLWFSLPDLPPVRNENVFYAIVENGHSFGFFRNAQGEAQLGWGLSAAAAESWKTTDWQQKILDHSPHWLAQVLQTQQDPALWKPSLFSVTVALAPQWSKPGFLLLGDAAHPMSPIRAQGINMALRDAIVAANHLVPLLQTDAEATQLHGQLDQAIAAIQAEREPEIRRAQALQAAELAQGGLLHDHPILRWGASQFSAIVGLGVKQSWLRRQQQLRLGVVPVKLEV